MTVTVMITTRNRASDLERTLRAVSRMNPPPSQILVTADGCTDGTLDLLRNWKSLDLIINERGRGSVASRDRMMREAIGDLVLALDDDSYPEQSDCLPQIIALFEKRPALAVLHFPQRSDEYPETLTQTRFGEPKLTASFPNSGAVLRKSFYLTLPGFENRFFHMYEEPDYALQCVAAGYEVLFWPEITVRHHYSFIGRNQMLVHRRHARNEFWSAWIRCPFPYVLAISTYRLFSQGRYAASQGARWFLGEPIWWWAALRGLPACLKGRKVVNWNGYKQWLDLSRRSKPPRNLA